LTFPLVALIVFPRVGSAGSDTADADTAARYGTDA
jgi:hypothetical protein